MELVVLVCLIILLLNKLRKTHDLRGNQKKKKNVYTVKAGSKLKRQKFIKGPSSSFFYIS